MMKLLVECNHCNGTGSKEVRKGNGDNSIIIEDVNCPNCNGKGKLVIRKHYLINELFYITRKINYNRDILNDKAEIPTSYYYFNTHDCAECDGKGVLTKQLSNSKYEEKECTKCSGTGLITPSTKEIYNIIFNEMSELKKQRKEISYIIDNKLWNSEEYKGYYEEHPHGNEEVCLRCTRYFARTDIYSINACENCTNESGSPENGCKFTPISSKANTWFRTKGYKKCTGYSEAYEHWKNI